MPKPRFPKLALPVKIPYAPMEALRAEELPLGPEWQYEPKWDGFRALVFRHGKDVVIQSKSGNPLGRYFPELVEAVRKLKKRSFVLDGEIILLIDGKVAFDTLQLRLHPAASRIAKLAKETPVTFLAFDILYDGGKTSLVREPLSVRRKRLVRFFGSVPKRGSIRLSPASRDPKKAREWFANFGALGLDGVIAKDTREFYHSGDREAMVKVKHLKSADCVVAGYRLGKKKDAIAALTLGLYDADGKLSHVGSTSSFSAAEKKRLLKIVRPLEGGPGFTGTAPGQSRWSADENEWIPLRPKLVCEVRYDYFNGERFRHGTKFLRWRPDKSPRLCRFDQLAAKRSKRGMSLF